MTSGTNACFTPITIGTKTAANRFVIQPMEFNDASAAKIPTIAAIQPSAPSIATATCSPAALA